MEIVEVMKARIRIDITHVAEKFLYAGKSDAVTDALAEQRGHIVSFGIVDGSEVVAVVADDHVNAFNAFDIVVDVIGIRTAVDICNGSLYELAVGIYEIFDLGNGKLIAK